jgi:hypothetical protein
VLRIGLDDDDNERGALRDGGDLGRRRRGDVAIDENGIEAGIAAEPLDRRGPAGAFVEGEAWGTRGRGHGEEADEGRAHETRRRKEGMEDSRKRPSAGRGAGRCDREMSPL